MATWHLFPEDRRRTHKWFLADDGGVAAFLKRWASKERPFGYRQEETTEIWIDGGGTVSVDEPMIRWKANGNVLGTFLGQVPFVLEALKSFRVGASLEGMYSFQGWTHTYLLSPTTWAESVQALEEIMAKYHKEITGQERAHADGAAGDQGVA